MWSSRSSWPNANASRTSDTPETRGANAGAWLRPVRQAHDTEAAIGTHEEVTDSVSPLDCKAIQLCAQVQLWRYTGTSGAARVGPGTGRRLAVVPRGLQLSPMRCMLHPRCRCLDHLLARHSHLRFLRDSLRDFGRAYLRKAKVT
jgi:hypothetical protein